MQLTKLGASCVAIGWVGVGLYSALLFMLYAGKTSFGQVPADKMTAMGADCLVWLAAGLAIGFCWDRFVRAVDNRT